MPLLETLPVGPDTAQWTVWGTVARIVVTDPGALAEARALVAAELAAVDEACSRFRDDSEISRLRPAAGRPVRVSERLAAFVEASLTAARRTDGDVDPTVGAAMRNLGYDRDFAELPELSHVYVTRAAPGWQAVRLSGRDLTVPAGVHLDLGATAKALAADRCAALVADSLGVGVLVGLGGDIATAGPAPDGWRILVQDRPGDPQCTVAVPAGAAIATSSTQSRTWRGHGRRLHHIVDPTTGLPADPVWRTVSAVSHRCVDANTITTAAVVRGQRAPAWLRELGVAARLVTAHGDVMTLGGWPKEEARSR